MWLNNPVPPLEASGTSGMKAALNGVLNLSMLDGWWIEAWEEGVTGWAVDEGDVEPIEAASGPSLLRPRPMRRARASCRSLSWRRERSTPMRRLLYDKLEGTVLPLWHGDREGWIRMMRQAISRIGPVFNSQHMMRRYASEAYLRSTLALTDAVKRNRRGS